MRLFAFLLPAALALDGLEDLGNKKKGNKGSAVDSFDCNGVAIADAVADAIANHNVLVSGCMDFETEEVVGDNPQGALGMKKRPEGVIGHCMFKCAEGFEMDTSERMLTEINDERAKKGKKPKKGKKDKKNKKDKKDKKNKKDKKDKPVKPEKPGKDKSMLKVSAICRDGESWDYVAGKKSDMPASAADLRCVAVAVE